MNYLHMKYNTEHLISLCLEQDTVSSNDRYYSSRRQLFHLDGLEGFRYSRY